MVDKVWLNDFVIEHQNLAFAYLSKHGFRDDPDMLSAALWGLTKAAMAYDDNIGLAFSTLATTCIQNAVRGVLRSRRNVKVIKEISFDECLENFNGDSRKSVPVVELISAVKDVALSSEEQAAYIKLRKILFGIINDLSPGTVKYNIYTTWYSSDFTYTQKQLSEICGVSQPHVSRTLQWLTIYISNKIKEDNK